MSFRYYMQSFRFDSLFSKLRLNKTESDMHYILLFKCPTLRANSYVFTIVPIFLTVHAKYNHSDTSLHENMSFVSFFLRIVQPYPFFASILYQTVFEPRSRVRPPPGRQHSFMDFKIFSTVGLSLPQLSVSSERMCTILVIRLEDKACPVKVWLGKLTALDMIPLGWLDRKTLTQANKQYLSYHFDNI